MRGFAYTMAMLMIIALTFILNFVYGIHDLWERIWITTYMVVYGALMAQASKKITEG